MGHSQLTCMYFIRLCLFRSFSTLTIVTPKDNQIGSLLHHDWFVCLSTHHALHKPFHSYTHAVDARLRKCLYDFPRRSNNPVVEFLVD
jgi:hypothetical protein